MKQQLIEQIKDLGTQIRGGRGERLTDHQLNSFSIDNLKTIVSLRKDTLKKRGSN